MKKDSEILKTAENLTMIASHGVGGLRLAPSARFQRLLLQKRLAARQAAFTLAEVLITISIMGIVAALTLPELIQNINAKTWSERSANFLAKLSEATNIMKVNDNLSGFVNTEDFVNELQKNIKIIKTCSSSELDKCFVPSFKTGEETIESSSLTTIKKIYDSTTETNNPTVGIIFVDGTMMILAYDANCPRINPYQSTPRSKDGKSETLGCMHMLYDINGLKTPNVIEKDIKRYRIEFAAKVTCTAPFVEDGGVCACPPGYVQSGSNCLTSKQICENGSDTSYSYRLINGSCEWCAIGWGYSWSGNNCVCASPKSVYGAFSSECLSPEEHAEAVACDATPGMTWCHSCRERGSWMCISPGFGGGR